MKKKEKKPAPRLQLMTTRQLACGALLAALSVVFARLIIPMPNQTTRFSIEAVPIFLAGVLLGPAAGGLVGFSADFIGCLFSPYGFNPLFSVPPVLYGVFGGLVRRSLAKRERVSLPALALDFLPPVILGSILYQSIALAYTYYYQPGTPGSFQQGLVYFLTTRSLQFAVTWVADVAVLFLLLRSGIFGRLRLWPPQTKKRM